MRLPTHTQVLVIGGGPAGSVTASLLAREGIEVVQLERARFPRYHIGESLLPSCLEVLELIGARERVEAYGFQRKPGAYLDWKGEQWMLDFGELRGQYQYSFQVQRAAFDDLLLKHAAASGATVAEGVGAESLRFDGERPCVACCRADDEPLGERRIAFDYLVDASGRAGLMATRYLRNRRFHETFQNIAVWAYWRGVRMPLGARDGAIVVVSIPEGWIWLIPFSDGTTSIGAVVRRDGHLAASRRGALDDLYLGYLASSETVARAIASGVRDGAAKSEADYSYRADRFAGPRYFLAGDAACFLDPLLSSGVHLAMYSGLLAAASIASALRRELTEAEAAAYYERSYRQAYLRFLFFVSAFYEAQGKHGYFREATRLSTHDVDRGDVQHAFRNLVSGLEDFADAEDATTHLIGEFSRRIDDNLRLRKDKCGLSGARHEADANAAFFDAIEGFPALSPAQSDGEFYVTTRPHLGVVRAAGPRPPG